jgi:hypothetical protein
MSSREYDKLKKEIIECNYCKTQVNLYYINKHLKSKKCQDLKKMYLISNSNINENEFPLFINELKKNLKYDNNEE